MENGLPFSSSILVCIETVFEFRLFRTDKTKYCIKIGEAITGEIFINKPKEFELKRDELINLLKRQYSLAEREDCRG